MDSRNINLKYIHKIMQVKAIRAKSQKAGYIS